MSNTEDRFQDCAYCEGAHVESDCPDNPDMNNLDDKLVELLLLFTKEILNDTMDGYDYDTCITQIKQAFADEGWSPDPLTEVKNINNLHTGQEWYDGFEKLLSNSTMIQRGLVLQAAKRASGIDKNN